MSCGARPAFLQKAGTLLHIFRIYFQNYWGVRFFHSPLGRNGYRPDLSDSKTNKLIIFVSSSRLSIQLSMSRVTILTILSYLAPFMQPLQQSSYLFVNSTRKLSDRNNSRSHKRQKIARTFTRVQEILFHSFIILMSQSGSKKLSSQLCG